MAAAAISFPICLDPQHHQNSSKTFPLKPHFLIPSQTFSFPLSKQSHIHKFHPLNCTPSISTTPSSESYRTGRFLSIPELQSLETLENFRYFHEFDESRSLVIRVMRKEEIDITVGLLAESFGESMALPFKNYVNLLAYLVKQYLVDRRVLMPHTATLVGYYRDGDGKEEELAGTVEISFNKRGANSNPPTPTPPKDSPYICNMTVKKDYRRRGIGWHLLKACEELISQMSISRDVYLHCRMIDEAPFNMYTKAGYSIIKTDNFLILLTLQRRKHLMCKTLPVTENKESIVENSLVSSSTPLSGISPFDNNLESTNMPESDVSNFDISLVSENSSEILENNLSFSSTSESGIPVTGDSNSS
ncbi:GCN5-related N-acetyltransferase 5 [Ranunculus cassubicifolius]